MTSDANVVDIQSSYLHDISVFQFFDYGYGENTVSLCSQLFVDFFVVSTVAVSGILLLFIIIIIFYSLNKTQPRKFRLLSKAASKTYQNELKISDSQIVSLPDNVKKYRNRITAVRDAAGALHALCMLSSYLYSFVRLSHCPCLLCALCCCFASNLVSLSSLNRNWIQCASDDQRSQPGSAVWAGRSFAVQRQRLLPRRHAYCSALLSVPSPGKISAVGHFTPCELIESYLSTTCD